MLERVDNIYEYLKNNAWLLFSDLGWGVRVSVCVLHWPQSISFYWLV